ncbi:hypothetical protein WICMUC_000659 [Wickerhamomyces mucosus]|uniref:Protein BFR2 n=1 Tax=Wickerhamomyces mucosus TaxID=1378264 RepID=A0A9P8PX12_9ASCO|nr:hypothetical protein WICMUC_000659 [Wickerhamomyces mucosus]
MSKKSLAEQISELYGPQSRDVDLEDSERGVFEHEDHSESNGEESEQDDEELKNNHYISVGKSKLRSNDISLKGERYKGKASSRSEIFNDEQSEDDDEEDDDEEDEEEEDDDEEDGDDDDLDQDKEETENSESDEEHFEKNKIGKRDLESEEEESGNESDSAVSFKTDSEDEGQDIDIYQDESHDEMTSKRDKLKALMAQERKMIINRLSTSTQTDSLKGYAVIDQQNVFDKIIDSRMKLQKAVTTSNLLPLNNEAFEEFEEDDTSAKLNEVSDLLRSLLNNVISLRTKIFNKEKVTREPLKFSFNRKRSFTEYCEESNQLDNLLSKYRDSVLTKWSHKVESASGATALSSTKFKALNQSAAQQVELNLMDMDRLVKRTRTNRRNVEPIGYVEKKEEIGENSIDEEKNSIDRSLKENIHIFDDEDFYRVLLNDLVDKKISDSNPTNGLTIQLTKTKLKKHVDTKASKGRKLKYTVQEKIQSYDAPRGNFKWSDEQIDEFFAGLLGQKVNFNEEEQQDENDDSEQYEALQNDDLRIFG